MWNLNAEKIYLNNTKFMTSWFGMLAMADWKERREHLYYKPTDVARHCLGVLLLLLLMGVCLDKSLSLRAHWLLTLPRAKRYNPGFSILFSFLEAQFWFILKRVRKCRPYMKWTLQPQARSWANPMGHSGTYFWVNIAVCSHSIQTVQGLRYSPIPEGNIRA